METAGGVEPPITGLQPVALPLGHAVKWSSEQESNPRQTAYKAAALPSELIQHVVAEAGFEPTWNGV